MKKLFVVFIILLVAFGCGGIEDSGDCSTPVITNVVFYTPTGDDFNPPHESTFNVGDEFDVIVYASDCDLDMYILYSDVGNHYLPPQTGVDRGYHFAEPFIMNIPAGVYIFEFQIEDYEGHISNIFPVVITVK